MADLRACTLTKKGGWKMVMQYSPNDSLRVKIENACNLRCTFCHQEGNGKANRMTLLQMQSIINFAKKYGYCRLHLTGGEPTLHPEIGKIIQLIKKSGLTCALTSNGQYKPRIIDELIDSRLDSINFSIPTINVDAWTGIQINGSERKSTRQINSVIRAIDHSIRRGLRTKLNIVVGNNPERAIEVIDNYSNSEAELRLLDILGNPQSIENIRWILHHFEAILTDEIQTLGTSQVKEIYNTSVGRVIVKGIQKKKVTSICKSCNEVCYEGIYGIRLESNKNKLYARLCLHRECDQTFCEFESLVSTQQFADIYKQSGIIN